MPTIRRTGLAFAAILLGRLPCLVASEPPLVGPPAPRSAIGAGALHAQATAQPAAPAAPSYQRDRGAGLPTSMFGTYIKHGELIVYPFFEYYKDNNFEYKPSELGYPGEEDYRGRFHASEGVFLLAYGLSENWAMEFEMAVIDASFDKSPDDPTSVPTRIEESGLGDVEGQFRYRWKQETERNAEWFSFFEYVIPHAKEKVLIGTPGWELKLGVGRVRGYSWGTLTVRAAVEYTDASASHFDLGEYAVEYLRRLSPSWRVYVGLEGTQDELSLITELQWHLSRNVYIKLNNGLGLTSKALDWTPEVGILFTIPTR